MFERAPGKPRAFLFDLLVVVSLMENFIPRFLYSITFADQTAYVGITIDPETRFYNHINGSCNKEVAKRINKIGYSISIHGLIKSKEELRKESMLAKFISKKGFYVLNIGSHGGIGRLPTRFKQLTDSEIKCLFERYPLQLAIAT